MPALSSHFTNIAATIAALLAQAQHEVLAAVAWLTHPDLARELARCPGRGCRVVLILNDDDINARHCPLDMLAAQGVQVIMFPQADEYAPLMHHKFCVIDGHTTITGSYNWTRKAEHNRENIVVLQHDAAFARTYVDTFNALAEQLGQLLGQGLMRSPLYAYYKRRIELLEAEVAALQAELAEVQGFVHRFERAYWARLGHLLRDIARYKAQLAEQQARRTEKEADRRRAAEARQQAEQFGQQAEAAEPPAPALDKEAAQSLRDLFRKIAKKIHPDRYANDPDLYERANRLMAEANAAYEAQDAAALQALLDRLENGLENADALPDNLDRLKQMAEQLARRYEELLQALSELKAGDTYSAALLPDQEAFFAAEEARLQAEAAKLREVVGKG